MERPGFHVDWDDGDPSFRTLEVGLAKDMSGINCAVLAMVALESDALHPSWAQSPQKLLSIQQGLSQGRVVRIHPALRDDVALALHKAAMTDWLADKRGFDRPRARSLEEINASTHDFDWNLDENTCRRLADLTPRVTMPYFTMTATWDDSSHTIYTWQHLVGTRNLVGILSGASRFRSFQWFSIN
eukprot:gnl/MRDRNA2_/MRDRNA2_80068_c0_seq1.p1 gnl/MRDRNA2_/MRDRNA2_80068_c0~~gnl/MRDRNA2_/MRDRNA2_80068_c0_seq1.p1  ORF type:complete len:186 (+),score=17.37 gnl/MRDRNA2_/MRDRNA2_80068_c0_seq1:112-669(+)